MSEQFEPVNVLEFFLLQAQRGRAPTSDFLDHLLVSQVVVLIDEDPGPSGVSEKGISPMILSKASGSQFMAMFTAIERVGHWPEQLPQFKFLLGTTFQWLLQGMSKNLGIVLNPGNSVGAELTPATLADIRLRLPPPKVAT